MMAVMTRVVMVVMARVMMAVMARVVMVVMTMVVMVAGSMPVRAAHMPDFLNKPVRRGRLIEGDRVRASRDGRCQSHIKVK